MDMRDHIKERSELAHTYACDGAYLSAARVLQDLATTIKAHADRVNASIDAVADECEPPLASWKVSDDGLWYVRNDGRYRVNRVYSVIRTPRPFRIQERRENGTYYDCRSGRYSTAKSAMHRACD